MTHFTSEPQGVDIDGGTALKCATERYSAYCVFFPVSRLRLGTTSGIERRGDQSSINSVSLPSRHVLTQILHRIMWYAV